MSAPHPALPRTSGTNSRAVRKVDAKLVLGVWLCLCGVWGSTWLAIAFSMYYWLIRHTAVT